MELIDKFPPPRVPVSLQGELFICSSGAKMICSPTPPPSEALPPFAKLGDPKLLTKELWLEATPTMPASLSLMCFARTDPSCMKQLLGTSQYNHASVVC